MVLGNDELDLVGVDRFRADNARSVIVYLVGDLAAESFGSLSDLRHNVFEQDGGGQGLTSLESHAGRDFVS